ncbi:MAG: hypothetical protein K9G41_03570 [Flavobacteriales bacterium]|nr:hypothetical protein [Flavobacteriales bacterium]
MRCLIRKKVKGDHQIPLTCADRVALVKEHKLQVSEHYILKVLSESNNLFQNHSQYILDQVVGIIDYKVWNEFLRKNPIPEAFYCKKRGRKSKKLLHEAVEQRLKELSEQP